MERAVISRSCAGREQVRPLVQVAVEPHLVALADDRAHGVGMPLGDRGRDEERDADAAPAQDAQDLEDADARPVAGLREGDRQSLVPRIGAKEPRLAVDVEAEERRRPRAVGPARHAPAPTGVPASARAGFATRSFASSASVRPRSRSFGSIVSRQVRIAEPAVARLLLLGAHVLAQQDPVLESAVQQVEQHRDAVGFERSALADAADRPLERPGLDAPGVELDPDAAVGCSVRVAQAGPLVAVAGHDPLRRQALRQQHVEPGERIELVGVRGPMHVDGHARRERRLRRRSKDLLLVRRHRRAAAHLADDPAADPRLPHPDGQLADHLLGQLVDRRDLDPGRVRLADVVAGAHHDVEAR